MNKRWHAWGVALVLTSVALSGCADKKSDSGGGGEPSSADFTANEYDRAIGNAGFRVTGSLTGTASAVDPASAAQIDILDLAQADGTDADKATLILDAKQTGLNVLASLRSMATPADAKSSASHFGGVARNVKVFGGTGVGPSALPETTAYMFATGLAQVRVEANTQSNKLVYVAVTPALRGADGAALATPDAANVQLHIVFPGSTIAGNAGIEGVTDGFLYYFFETVEDKCRQGD